MRVGRFTGYCGPLIIAQSLVEEPFSLGVAVLFLLHDVFIQFVLDVFGSLRRCSKSTCKQCRPRSDAVV